MTDRPPEPKPVVRYYPHHKPPPRSTKQAQARVRALTSRSQVRIGLRGLCLDSGARPPGQNQQLLKTITKQPPKLRSSFETERNNHAH